MALEDHILSPLLHPGMTSFFILLLFSDTPELP
jgi:hypothetical protein